MADMSDRELATLVRDAQEIVSRLRTGLRQRWNRDLPLDELLSDRWTRAQSLGFGEGTNIYGTSYVYGDVRVGRRTWIGPYTLLDGSGGLEIGDNCNVSAGVQIYTHDTVKRVLSGGSAPHERAPVRVGNCVYLGSQAVVLKGLSIGDYCVIGACSLVTRDIPPYSVAFGVPCRVVGRVVIRPEGDIDFVMAGAEAGATGAE
jgi:acetyltransferase-like isoleucine patch superfamily enzyme